MSVRFNRRQFLRRVLTLSAAGAALGLSGCGSRAQPEPPAVASQPAEVLPAPTAAPPAAPAVTPQVTAAAAPTAPPAATPSVLAPSSATGVHLAVAHGTGADPGELTRRAIAALGGIERFVKRGADVIIKPNICNAYHGPEYASTTNPDVVAALVSLCLGAGARRVRVMDYPFGGSPQAAYEKSGIAAAVKVAGGEMEAMSSLKFRDVEIPQGRRLKQWKVYGDILDADVVINVPIAKNHGSATLTLGMKNLMGVVQDRTGMHARGLHQSIADINTAVKPQLTVVDAIRMLMANGPTGGNLNDVKQMDTVIASADVVAADAFATTLFGLKPADIGYIKLGSEMGLGQMDLDAIRIERVAV